MVRRLSEVSLTKKLKLEVQAIETSFAQPSSPSGEIKVFSSCSKHNLILLNIQAVLGSSVAVFQPRQLLGTDEPKPFSEIHPAIEIDGVRVEEISDGSRRRAQSDQEAGKLARIQNLITPLGACNPQPRGEAQEASFGRLKSLVHGSWAQAHARIRTYE
jgi:hypothetical protein